MSYFGIYNPDITGFVFLNLKIPGLCIEKFIYLHIFAEKQTEVGRQIANPQF
jgi:hypothetical protein